MIIIYLQIYRISNYISFIWEYNWVNFYFRSGHFEIKLFGICVLFFSRAIFDYVYQRNQKRQLGVTLYRMGRFI